MESIHICLHHSNQCLYLSILPCQTKVPFCKVMYDNVPFLTFLYLSVLFCTFLYLLEPFGNFGKNVKSILLSSLTKILPTHIDPKSVCLIFLAHISLSSCSFKAFVVLLLLLQLILFISKPHTIVYDEEEKEGEMRERAFFSDSLERLLRAVRERSSQQ